MRKKLLLTLIAMLLSGSVWASSSKHFDVNYCRGVDSALSTVSMSAMHRNAEISKEAMPLLKKLNAIVAEAKNPNEPIGKQLSTPDSDNFSEISAELGYLNAQSYKISSIQRDMDVLANLCHASQALTKIQTDYIDKHNGIDSGYAAWQKQQIQKLPKKAQEYIYVLYLLHKIEPSDEEKSFKTLKKGP